MIRTARVWLLLFGVACYAFGAFSVTADELYGLAISCGGTYEKCRYSFPLITHSFNLWDSWVIVFTGLAVSFFVAAVTIMSLVPRLVRDPSEDLRKQTI